MSATVETVFLYEAVCPDCNTGSVVNYESESDALEWAATHDAENHGDNGTNDEDYERFKEARNGD